MTEYEILKAKLEKGQKTDINKIKESEIDDVKNLKIDSSVSSNERIIDFIKKAKNPYIIKVGDTIVKMTYNSSNKQALECIKNIVTENI